MHNEIADLKLQNQRLHQRLNEKKTKTQIGAYQMFDSHEVLKLKNEDLNHKLANALGYTQELENLLKANQQESKKLSEVNHTLHLQLTSLD